MQNAEKSSFRAPSTGHGETFYRIKGFPDPLPKHFLSETQKCMHFYISQRNWRTMSDNPASTAESCSRKAKL